MGKTASQLRREIMQKDRLADMMRGIRELTGNSVYVGIPDKHADRKNDEPKNPITNAGIGSVMEHGSPELNIPPRPFLSPGVEDAKDEIRTRMRAAADKAIEGDVRATEAAFGAVGIAARNSVIRKITNGPFQPLADATIANRKRRGRKGTKPLLDTGQLRRAIDYVVRK